MDRLSHPFPPLYDAESRILILGSFPSVKSREAMFFYGHPQNRFWRVVPTVLGCDCPRTIEEKQQMLYAHHIALWDAIASCEITGSSDSSIREAVPTDLTPILKTAPIRQIFCNGATSYQLYCRHQQKADWPGGRQASLHQPRQRRLGIERLTQAWSVIPDALD